MKQRNERLLKRIKMNTQKTTRISKQKELQRE